MTALVALLLAAGAHASDLDKRVDRELAQPAFKEVQNAAKALGSADQSAPEPTWGAWARMPTTPGVRTITKFIDDWIIQPLFAGANAGGAAKALASADPHATAATRVAVSEEALNEQVMGLVGRARVDPASLELAPSEVKSAPAEKRGDSISLVFKKKKR